MTVALPTGFGPLQEVAETGSTNGDLLAADGPTGEVLVTRHQTAGRGRFDRRWEETPGSSLLFSVRLRPSFTTGLAWLSPLAGLAVADAVAARVAGVQLRWPNDVLVGEGKIAGILVEARGDVVVIGAGCNITQTADELPVGTATSLAASGAADVAADDLLTDVLAALARRYDALTAAGGDADASGLRVEYTQRCATVGQTVTVRLTDGDVTGRATGVAGSGALVLETDTGRRELSAGDVVRAHRPPA